ncbi:hypothetical protein [Paraburkholderia sp. RL17-337-BIB-A]|uniref:hypothetical protein n=1 Tax=Paraburkholderia sp. RL17-337-BIB-A TaxID=3031636 RepID=UPI0038B9CB47
MTYLVVSQLKEHRAAGGWLRVEHLLAAARGWMRLNSGDVSWPQRLTLASRAQQLAEHVMRVSEMTCDAKTIASMFVDGLHLDFRSPAVTEIYFISAAQLQTH